MGDFYRALWDVGRCGSGKDFPRGKNAGDAQMT